MKIVHIISSLDRGGAENHLVTLACEQKKIGYDVVVIYLSGNNYWRPFLKKRKIKVIETRIQNKYSLIDLLSSIFALKKQFSILKPDLVHLHLSLPELMIIIYRIFFFKSFKSFKLIITKHLDSFILEGTYGQHKLIRGIFLEKILFKISDHVIFISKQVKKYFKKEIFFQEKKNTEKSCLLKVYCIPFKSQSLTSAELNGLQPTHWPHTCQFFVKSVRGTCELVNSRTRCAENNCLQAMTMICVRSSISWQS